MDRAALDPLQAIRSSIDTIDAQMHRLLIDRSGVIEELIRIKGASAPGAAFRPGREADMMRRLAMRHEGALPLVTVEHIWREIITTFTAMQAPFGIAAGPDNDLLAMRDLIRFYFGFSISVTNYASGGEAVAQVARTGTDIAVLSAAWAERWWGDLADPCGPKIFAKLPFIDLPTRPAALAAFVVGPPLKDAVAPDMQVYAVSGADGIDRAIGAHGGAIVARFGRDSLVELPIAAEIGGIVPGSDGNSPTITPLGGYFQPIRALAEGARTGSRATP